MARPTKLTPEITELLCAALRDSNSRTAAVASAGIDYKTFLNWLEKGEQKDSGAFSQFFHAVTRAEKEAEARNVGVLQKAADGWPIEERKRTTRTEIRMRKIRQPDGTVIEEPVTLELVTEEVVTRWEFDWRAAESILKRRFRADWGDNVNVDLDAEIARLMAKLAGQGEAEATE